MKTPLTPRIGIAGLLATAILIPFASAQNVGIGTTTPKSKLSVNGSTASGGMAIGDATYASTTGTVAPLNGAIIQGFTGIGTTAPIALLHVLDGNILRSNTDGTAQTTILSGGGVRTYRDGPSLGSPMVNGFFDVQNSTTGGTAYGRMYYYKGVAGQTAPLDSGEGLGFYASATSVAPQLLLETATGNVGINTVDPQTLLDVRGTITAVATTGARTGSIAFGQSNANGFQSINDTTNGDAFVAIQRSGPSAALWLSKTSTVATNDIYVAFTANGVSRGTITVSGAGVAYNTTSDLRLKENIHPSAKGLDDVMKIQVSDYNYKSTPDRSETGFIAQQLNTVFPNAVTPGGEDATKNPWTVDYGRLTPVLVKAVQEQQAEIAALKAENEKLKAQAEKFDALAARMEAMEKSMTVSTKGHGDTVRTVILTK